MINQTCHGSRDQAAGGRHGKHSPVSSRPRIRCRSLHMTSCHADGFKWLGASVFLLRASCSKRRAEYIGINRQLGAGAQHAGQTVVISGSAGCATIAHLQLGGQVSKANTVSKSPRSCTSSIQQPLPIQTPPKHSHSALPLMAVRCHCVAPVAPAM
jgi:hypothetical protein